ncbi:MAG TPA: carbon-nitrogen hydrolase [Polyangiaceae bacterium]|nr:carbon-nitrogen hydrolase [Polyangiaceae bacterium]
MAAGSIVRVGLIQLSATADKAENIERTVRGIEQAAQKGAQLICTQELFATHYFCQTHDMAHFDWAEPLDGACARALRAAAKAHGVCIVGSLFERRTAGVYHNSALVIGPDGNDLGLYRKMHIPDDPQFEEKYYFTPGDTGFVSVNTPLGNVGPLICWDQWYPEAARLCALQGAQILVYPTAIGWLPSEKNEYGVAQLSAWQTAQRAHAISNGVFLVAVNRVGFEPAPAKEGIEFWGNSFVVDPGGTVIAQAGLGEEILVVDCDLSLIERQRRDWPFLRDRRIDAYTGLTSRYLEK